ncbi:MAG: hypothetical protein KTR28_02050 [Micavibrio sp.]|nr:hypothetical protein [Micavibrio sp.]
MTNDDINKPEDDFDDFDTQNFEDLDIEDIDDIDGLDLDDVDFDEDFETDIDVTAAEELPTGKGGKKPKKEKKAKVKKEKAVKEKKVKSGKSGNKVVVLAGGAAVVAVGGYMALNMLGGAPAPTPAPAYIATDEGANIDSNGMPPMPVPMDAGADQAQIPNDIEPVPVPDSVPNELMPIPDVADASNELEPLPDLPNFSDDVSELTPPSRDEIAELVDIPSLDKTAQEPVAELDASVMGMEDVDSTPDEDTAGLPVPTEVADLPVEDFKPESVGSNVTMPAPPADVAIITAQPDPEILEELEDAKSLNEELEAQNSKNEKALNSANETIESLQKTITDLESKVNKLSGDLEAANDRIENVAKAAPKVEASKPAAKKAVVSAPKPKVTSAPAPVKINWIMRSARPGFAIIANADNGDTRTVEVGETIAGLGRISSIAQESGRWVLRGSKGIVSQ